MQTEQVEGENGAVAFFRSKWDSLADHEGVSPRTQIMALLLAVFVIFTRRPSELLHAQFYAEDGAVWYAQAYNGGWLHSLGIPDGGYLNTIQRLGAGLALLFPFHLAPLVMDFTGLIVQALPVVALLSRRCAPWGSLQMRAVVAAIYVLVPNAIEIHVVLTNAQWHWAFLVVLLAFGAAPRGWAGRITDAVVFLVGSVSGPFCLILFPLILVFYVVKRQRWTGAVLGLLLPGVLIQAYFVVYTVRIFPKPLGATPMLFLRLLGGHIFLETLVGASRYTPQVPAVIIVLIVVAGLVIVGFGNYYGGTSLRLFTVFAATVFLAGIKSPLIAGPKPLWELLLIDSGARYYFYPMLVFIWSALWCAARGKSWIRYAGYGIAWMLCLAIVRQYYYKPYNDHQFSVYAARFEGAKPGEQVVIPIYPDPTIMTLDKK